MNMEKKRKELYNYVIKTKEMSNLNITDTFEKEFWNYLEKVIISLYDEENHFFGQFLIQVKRKISFKIKWPIATNPTMSGFVMFFNPIFLLECDLNEIQALLKHEIYHIIMGHYVREKKLKNKYSKLAISIAMDLAINQYIKNLPAYSKHLEGVNLEFNLKLNYDMTIEQYAKEIQEAIDYKEKHKGKDNINYNEIDQEQSHEIWEETSLNLDNLRQITKKTSINAYKGKAPKAIERIIVKMEEKPEIKWNEFLKRLLLSAKSGHKKTITRRDRRMPDRVDLRGKLPKYIPKIIIAIDISASMGDKDIEKVIVEILGVIKNKQYHIKVIECDSKIRRIYDVNSIKDIRKRSKNNGDTKFSPVFKYLKENNMRDYILIYFTDGVGENELEVRPINNKTCWILIGNEDFSLKKTYGIVKRLNREDHSQHNKNYGLQELKESILELRETIHD